jgi:hypothetical protein
MSDDNTPEGTLPDETPGVDPEKTTEQKGEDLANTLARPFGAVGRAFAAFLNQLLYLLLRFTPGGAKFWKGLAKASLYNYHKRSGGDALGVNHLPNEGVELLPIKYQQGLEELDDKPGWKAKGRDKVWEPSAQGQALSWLGKTPLVMLDDDADYQGTWLDCGVVDAIDKGNMRELYRADAGTFTAEITDHSGVIGGGAARADGGYNVERDFVPETSPIFEDMIIDLGSGEGFNGSAISFRRYADIARDTSTQEKLKLAEQRGYLAGMDPGEYKSLMLKIMLIGGAVAIAGLVGPEIVAALFGGGGDGGGGSVIPFQLGGLW